MKIISYQFGLIIAAFAVATIGKLITGKNSYVHEDQKLCQQLSEKQIDRMVEDSFPASDPPSTY